MAFQWSQSLRKGKQGEQAVMSWLESQGWTVTNLSQDQTAQQRDIDGAIVKEDSGPWMVEIKTDSHEPINLFVELTVDGKPGYLYKSRADILLYYFPLSRKLYWVSMAALAWWVHEHAGDLRRIEVRSQRGKGKEWLAEGIAVPIADLGALVKEYEV